MAELTIRPMNVQDVEAVWQVENATFSAPWTKEIFYGEITRNDHAYYFVMLLNDKIIGYVGVWVVVDDAQITNIAVLPEYRGKKLGEKLFRYTIQKLILMNVSRLSLEVRESNIAAQKMYRKFGLVPGGIRKNYYVDNQEDAIVMWVNLK
ncbi:ribosomal protein S18-alanine N-acetyltransferase [Virgibacillus kimchii]